jgi:hypothetical protein
MIQGGNFSLSSLGPTMQALETPGGTQPLQSTRSLTPYAGGLVRMVGMKQLNEEARRQAEAVQNQPAVQGLAAHVRRQWSSARAAKQTTVEPRMMQAIRQRRGEYDPDVLAKIRQQGGSEIFMMLTSTKCRAAASWLRDTLLGVGSGKPWSIDPSVVPDLPPSVVQAIHNIVQGQVAQFTQTNGVPPTPEMVDNAMQLMRERVVVETENAAKRMASNMETKMEDQLLEGGWYDAFSAFLDDIVTFPSAIVKGPVVRRKPKMQWVDGELEVVETTVLEWDRVDPLCLYPSAQATNVNDGSLFERHRLSRGNLNELIGVEGYDDASIRAVLDEYGRGGLREWLTSDVEQAEAEGKSTAEVLANPDQLIDALQYWGSVQGKQLIEWGVPEEQVPDATKEYQCEVWMIGRWVIKASINPDPLGRRPYYKASYEEVPGAFWGNGVTDLVRDTQAMCNAAARSLANNMGIASGPQVWVNVNRLPDGENITQMYPWKIWQGTDDRTGANSDAVRFFQPSSNASELMAVYSHFSTLADEYSGIPRYMSGTEGITGGAGRTASGLSMMMGNAGKAIKQVVGNIDIGVMKPLVSRLYFYNMRYSDDPELKGDVNIVARGATLLIVKEQAQVRRNEFMNLALNNQTVNQIVGPEGVAALLREVVSTLDMKAGDIVPSRAAIRANQLQQQQMQQQQMQMMSMMEQPQPAMAPPGGVGNGQQLMNGAPMTDLYQPQSTS